MPHPKKSLTACLDCKFHRAENEGATNSHIWYNHYCTASPRPDEFDCLTGKMVAAEPLYENCNRVNQGHCPKFQRK